MRILNRLLRRLAQVDVSAAGLPRNQSRVSEEPPYLTGQPVMSPFLVSLLSQTLPPRNSAQGKRAPIKELRKLPPSVAAHVPRQAFSRRRHVSASRLSPLTHQSARTTMTTREMVETLEMLALKPWKDATFRVRCLRLTRVMLETLAPGHAQPFDRRRWTVA